MRKWTKLLSVAALAMTAQMASAESWTLNGDNSTVAFGSVKKDTVGEVHSFSGLSGSVSEDGAIALTIDLATVETNIEIRNERMLEHVFKGAKTASVAAQVDMADVNALAVGQSTLVDVEGVLSLVGTDIELEAEMFVLRVAEDKVMVSTNSMVFLSMADANLMAGIDKLMELAKLPGITRTSPVTMRLMFDAGEDQAAVTTDTTAVEVAAVTGDVKAGKKVYRKCKACHKLDEGKNGTGPTLYQIIGKPAGGVDGFKYSSAMAESGLTWDAATLAEFLAKPKALVPGTKMSFSGLRKEADIENVIAYIQSES